MANKFSPGPWRYFPPGPSPRDSWYFEDANGSVVIGSGERDCPWNYDARLIAAAPEMYELLSELADYEHRWRNNDDWCEALMPKLYAVMKRIDGED